MKQRLNWYTLNDNILQKPNFKHRVKKEYIIFY